MTKNILIITLASVLAFACPVVSNASPSVEIIENDFNTVTISIRESTLYVTGANGEMLEIYNVAGMRVMSIKVEGADRHYELNLPKGCYIVKVGKTVRKISIK